MEKKLQEEKIKITPQRIELIRKLRELEKTHPSFNSVYNAIKKTHPHISRSTVHENLKLLVKKGMIRKFYYKGETRYEINPKLHINLVEADGTIKDIENNEINQHLKEIEKILRKNEKIKVKNLLVLVE
ncbi:MAG: transcriptional repressor [Euryarchaeota archaeon]|jgi:Fe2+ or Zn2+ uptake regulation protein|nr:transcriptional repressor [Euryarchaeota archaeon]HHT19053.1 transcriptional repressor [Methanobacterium sp.]